MAAIPQSMLMAKSRRKKQGKPAPSCASSTAQSYYGTEPDYPPKYSTKMMDSIWGMYNEYSVHNLKAEEYGNFQATLGIQTQPMQNIQGYHLTDILDVQTNLQAQDKSSARQLGVFRQVAFQIFPNMYKH